jgi:hypothetical protein
MKIQNVAVYLASHCPKDRVYEEAVISTGEYLAENGYTLVYGGSNEGTMKTLADAVLGNGGKAIGVFTSGLPAHMRRADLTECHMTETLAERKAKMLELADVVVALPGSFGTWDELFDALAISKMNSLFHDGPMPIGLINVNGFYDKLLDFINASIEAGITPASCSSLLKSAPTIDELMKKFISGE